MATAFNTRKRIRRFFGHIESVAPMPNLIDLVAVDRWVQLGDQLALDAFLQAALGLGDL